MTAQPRSRQLVIVLMLGALAGCAGPSSGPEAALCEYDLDRPDNFRVGHILQSGQYAPGEIDPKIFKEWTDSVPSSMARPNQDVFRREVRADCHNEERNYWYPCYKVVEAELADIRGIGRSMNLDSSDRLAVRLCERLTQERAPRIGGLDRDSSDLQCYVSYRVACPLPGE